jgi:3-oxoacyl-[acyl-carrier-protein] synthase-3
MGTMNMNTTFGIAATKYFIPDKKIPVTEIVKGMDVEEHLLKNIGIEEIYVSETESQFDMALRAAKGLLQDQGMKPADLDMIIYSTNFPEKLGWSASIKLAYELGLRPFYTLDIYQGCNSFIAAMDIAQKYITADKSINNILYATADKSPITYIPGFSFYSNGAAAVLFSRNNIKIEPLSLVSFGDGYYADQIYIMGGLENPKLTGPMVDQIDQPDKKEFFMELFRALLNYMEKAVKKALEKASIDREDIDLFIPNNETKATSFFLKERLNLKEEKIFVKNIPRGFHVGASDLIINLHDVAAEKRNAVPLKVCLISSAGGFFCGSSVLKIY